MGNKNKVTEENLKLSNQESKEFTRNCIKTALIHLMKSTPFEKITVTAIIERAGVSRAGFYRNYSSKEDVLDDMSTVVYEKLKVFQASEEFKNAPFERYYYLFKQLTKYSDLISLIVKAQAPYHKVLEESTYRTLYLEQSTSTERYRAIAKWYALKEICIDWLNRGMIETPEEMAEILTNILPE